MAGIKDYSIVPENNTALFPEGMAPSAVNDGMRQVQADIRAEVAGRGADMASAETLNLGAATGDFVDITGTTTIVSLGAVSAGIRRTVRFRGALTLTHNAASLILPGGTDVTTADGDIARFRSLGSGNWVCEGYSRANGSILGEVATVNIADGAVSTAKIADAAVSKAKISADQQVPTGAVMAFATSVPPPGWLACDGSAVSRTTYADLFDAIGTIFGEGDESTTFNLPDLRGEFIRGWDNGRGIDEERAFGSTQLDALQNITGSFGDFKPTGTGVTETGAFARAGEDAAGSFADQGTGTRRFDFDASRVARTSTETRPRNLALLYSIKY